MSIESAICGIFTLFCITSGTTAVDLHDRFGTGQTTDKPALWTNGVVPYLMSTDYNASGREVIFAAMHEFHRFTCIRVVPRTRTDQHNFIIIKPKQGCSAYIGRKGGAQYLSLVNSCLTKKTIINKIMQTLGYSFEAQKQLFLTQSRKKRDERRYNSSVHDRSKRDRYAIQNRHTFIVRSGLSFASEMAINKMYDCPQQHPDESIDNPNWNMRRP